MNSMRAVLASSTAFSLNFYLLSLLVTDAAVTRILHHRCARVCHFQVKKLNNFPGPEPLLALIPFNNSNLTMKLAYECFFSENPGYAYAPWLSTA